MHIETIAVHSGIEVDPGTGAVTPPITLATTFAREADGSYPHGYIYSRSGNPNRNALEQCLAALEEGAISSAFASGSAATLAIFQALRPGDHVVAPTDVYYGTTRLLREIMGPWGLTATFVDMSDLDAVSSALTPNTRLLWTETPSNPLLKVTDIAAVAALAHGVGALCACDNTWATPVLQRPLAAGADLVMHATTKYLGGHGDVLGGAVVGARDDEWFARLRDIQRLGGAVAAPFDCWLVLRGIRTLPYRVRAQSASAMAIAMHLAEHPRVAAVHYPGLPGNEGYAVARAQMSAFGGMLSFQVRGGREMAMGVAGRVQVITRATSLGGAESLIEHRASVEGPNSTTPDDLLRLSVGLEHVDDLIADLDQALQG